jgi:NADPH:quinone reductase
VAFFNKRILLNSYPDGWVTEDNFTCDSQPVPGVPVNGVLIRNLYMSVDPYMRGRMTNSKSYIPPFQIGKPLQAGMVGEVIESRNLDYAKGDIVSGMLNWEEYTLTNGSDSSGGKLKKVDPTIAPLSYHLGILGMPGMTAWVGVSILGVAKKGETLFVSAASGAVGSVVGQIGKNLGLRVVGSAGGPKKCAYLIDELGFDQAIDYKTITNPFKAVQQACPDMIDVLFENVGGPMFEAAILNMNFMGRISLCGMISDYNKTLEEMEPGPRGLMTLIGRNIKMQGFIVFNYPEACNEWVEVASKWLSEGKLKYQETIAEGIESAPSAFISMFKGKNRGKQIVKISGL